MSRPLAASRGIYSGVGAWTSASNNGPDGMDRQARLMGNRRADMRGLNEGVIMNASNSRFHERRKIQSRRDHNLPRNGNDLPKKRFASDEVAKAQAEVLQGVFGNLKSPAKEMARETGLNERACRNQIAGLNSMNLADFFNACQAIPELQAWGAMMMGLSPSDPQFAKELARGHREIVLRIEGGNLTLGGGGENG